MVLSVGFGNGRAYLRNRFVHTEGFQHEEQAGPLALPGCVWHPQAWRCMCLPMLSTCG